MAPAAVRCLLCGHHDVLASTVGRFVTCHCNVCGETLDIEFNPPDDATLRARITQVTPDVRVQPREPRRVRNTNRHS